MKCSNVANGQVRLLVYAEKRRLRIMTAYNGAVECTVKLRPKSAKSI